MAIAGLAISLIAVLVSLVAFEVNRRSARDAERHGRMPVLIARQAADAVGVVNVGNAPGLNVVIAQGSGKLASVDVLHVALEDFQRDGTWVNHMHLAQVPAGGEHWYAWSWGDPVIGLTYTDALGHPYTAVSSRFGTKVVDGFRMTHPPLPQLTYPEVVEAPTHG
jgi:hypothetical protein